MAPGFLSKFVKPPTINGRASSETPTTPERPSSERKLTPSSTVNSSSTLSPSNRASVLTNGTTSSQGSMPNVNVVPPSPISSAGFPELNDSASSKGESGNGLPRRASIANMASPSLGDEPELATPTPVTMARNRSPSATLPAGDRPKTPRLSPSSSTGNLKKQKSQELKSQRSDKSLNLAPINTSHGRAATEPPTRLITDEHGVLETMTPIVESPTAIRHEYMSSEPISTLSSHLAPGQKDTDTASIISTNNEGKKRSNTGWRRGSSNTKKPTGLASAIAASGLAMANPALSTTQQSQLSPTRRSTSSRRKSSVGSVGYYLTNSPPGSADFSAGTRRSMDKTPNRKRTNSTAVSVKSGDHSDARVASETGHYSGLEDSSDEDEYESDDGLLDQISGDIPVTGFAVASNKRNADFHELFPTIPEGDYLIDDYGCALQREILIQGRIYISENHICFHANIFGWITDLVIPIYDVLSLEKKMTAFVIPNAIMITTRQNKYTFASFLARDTTYDVIYNIWRLVRPPGEVSERPSLEGPLNPSEAAAPGSEPGLSPKKTKCQCGKEGKHYAETALETIIPGTPERIYNLIFASGFIKDFMRDDQKLMDIQISDWAPVEPGSKLLARNMSYIKPLNGSIGPKQTKCEIRDETVHCDFDDYIATVTTTRTPEVPSGGAFSVKTRTCIMWASAVSSQVVVTTEVEWTGRSFIKGIIEKSAIDGQKTYHAELDKAVRAYIQEHRSEFIPEGVSLDEVAPTEATPNLPDEPSASADDGRKREHERNQRSLQWAWDTFNEAYEVAKRSTSGAIDLVTDAWDQSTSTTILYFVIVLLVISNLWTLTRMGQREEVGRRKEMRKTEEREKWIQGIVATLWDEIKAANPDTAHPVKGVVTPVPVQGNLKSEVAALSATLDAVEERIRSLRSKIPKIEGSGNGNLD